MKGLIMFVVMSMVIMFANASCAKDENGFDITRNVVYGQAENGTELKMIIVDKPDGNDFKPACVAIHGGAWVAGRAEDFMDQSRFMASQGFKVFNIDYRLAPGARMSQQVADCRTAVRHIRANAKRYGINPNRIAAMGHSAGGHLCCMLAVLKPGMWEGTGNRSVSSRVQGVLNLCGPEELDWYHRNAEGGQVDNIFDNLVENKTADRNSEMRKISPINYVTPACCPIFTLHGRIDYVVPAVQGEDFHRVLNEKKVPNEIIIMDDEDHGLARHIDATIAEITRFCDDFKGQKGIFAPAKVTKKL